MLLLAILFAWWMVPAAVKSFTRAQFWQFQAPSWRALAALQDLQDYWSLRGRSKNELIEAGRDLARVNAAYELRLQREQALQSELARLEDLLDLPPEEDFRYEVARVVRRELNSWWQTIVINKGKRDGIFEGAAVVYRGGVAGRVREARANDADVDLITSPSFRMAAHFENDLRPVTFQGGLNVVLRDPFGRVQNAPPDLEPSEENPRRLVSSRLGGMFPDGFTVGWVTELEPGPRGLFQSGPVQLDEQLLSLREVAVVIPLREELSPVEGEVEP